MKESSLLYRPPEVSWVGRAILLFNLSVTASLPPPADRQRFTTIWMSGLARTARYLFDANDNLIGDRSNADGGDSGRRRVRSQACAPA